jgi:hypothetical protein
VNADKLFAHAVSAAFWSFLGGWWLMWGLCILLHELSDNSLLGCAAIVGGMLFLACSVMRMHRMRDKPLLDCHQHPGLFAGLRESHRIERDWRRAEREQEDAHRV